MITGDKLFAVAIDPVAERVLLNDGTLAKVIDWVDDDLMPIEPDEATVAVYPVGDEWAATDLELLAWFTVH